MDVARGIDVHSHVVPENFPSYLGTQVPAQWPSMAPAHACHRRVMIEGKNYRTVSDLCWDAASSGCLFGTSRLLIGTDYPFNFHDRAPVARLVDAGLEPAAMEQILHSNAERFLGLVQGSLS